MTDTTDLSSIQLDRISERATKFLSGVSQVPSIRWALDGGGYTEAEHQRGWELLLELLGYKAGAGAIGRKEELRQRAAAAELDQWDGPSFERARAALDHRFPEQSAYVFDGLTSKTGAESIGAVRTFVDRIAALRDGTDAKRTASREADKAAAELLAQRRIIDADEERRLRALITEATSLPQLPQVSEPDPTLRQQTAKKLEAWLRDWRETARVLITRRDYQIRLGLSERRMAKAGEADAPAG